MPERSRARRREVEAGGAPERTAAGVQEQTLAPNASTRLASKPTPLLCLREERDDKRPLRSGKPSLRGEYGRPGFCDKFRASRMAAHRSLAGV